jgi:hypothetical protein
MQMLKYANMHECANVRMCKYTNTQRGDTQINKYANTQRQKYTNAQEYKSVYENTQRQKCAKIQIRKDEYANIQIHQILCTKTQ